MYYWPFDLSLFILIKKGKIKQGTKWRKIKDETFQLDIYLHSYQQNGCCIKQFFYINFLIPICIPTKESAPKLCKNKFASVLNNGVGTATWLFWYCSDLQQAFVTIKQINFQAIFFWIVARNSELKVRPLQLYRTVFYEGHPKSCQQDYRSYK